MLRQAVDGMGYSHATPCRSVLDGSQLVSHLIGGLVTRFLHFSHINGERASSAERIADAIVIRHRAQRRAQAVTRHPAGNAHERLGQPCKLVAISGVDHG